MMDNRVCFYSPNDLSIGYNLELAEKAIIKYKSEPASTLTDVIELFHIKKLIDNDCRLKCWSDIMFNQIKEDIKNYNIDYQIYKNREFKLYYISKKVDYNNRNKEIPEFWKEVKQKYPEFIKNKRYGFLERCNNETYY